MGTKDPSSRDDTRRDDALMRPGSPPPHTLPPSHPLRPAQEREIGRVTPPDTPSQGDRRRHTRRPDDAEVGDELPAEARRAVHNSSHNTDGTSPVASSSLSPAPPVQCWYRRSSIGHVSALIHSGRRLTGLWESVTTPLLPCRCPSPNAAARVF